MCARAFPPAAADAAGVQYTATGGGPLALDGTLTLCARADLEPTRFFSGSIAFLKIFNVALTGAQMRALYDAESGPPTLSRAQPAGSQPAGPQPAGQPQGAPPAGSQLRPSQRAPGSRLPRLGRLPSWPRYLETLRPRRLPRCFATRRRDRASELIWLSAVQPAVRSVGMPAMTPSRPARWRSLRRYHRGSTLAGGSPRCGTPRRVPLAPLACPCCLSTQHFHTSASRGTCCRRACLSTQERWFPFQHSSAAGGPTAAFAVNRARRRRRRPLATVKKESKETVCRPAAGLPCTGCPPTGGGCRRSAAAP